MAALAHSLGLARLMVSVNVRVVTWASTVKCQTSLTEPTSLKSMRTFIHYILELLQKVPNY